MGYNSMLGPTLFIAIFCLNYFLVFLYSLFKLFLILIFKCPKINVVISVSYSSSFFFQVSQKKCCASSSHYSIFEYLVGELTSKEEIGHRFLGNNKVSIYLFLASYIYIYIYLLCWFYVLLYFICFVSICVWFFFFFFN